MAWVAALAVALIALILAPGVSFYFDVTPKLVVLVAAVAVAWQWPRATWRNPLWLLTGLTAVSLAMSAGVGANPELSVWGSTWRRYGVIAQLAVLLLALVVSAQAPRLALILRVISAAGALTAIYGIAQYFGFDPILPAAGYHVGEGVWSIVRPPSTLGYVSYFATWLVGILFLSLAVPGRAWRSVAALAGVAMLLTGTRAAVLGAVAGFAVWLWWRGWRVPRRALSMGALALIAAGVFVISPAGQAVRSRARWFAEDPWGGARPLLWRDSLRMAMARPVLGYGPEVFSAEFPRYESAALARAYPDFAHESPHNIFLDALVAQGVPGVLLLFTFCAAGWRAAWRSRIKHRDAAAGLAAAFTATLVSQQFTVFTLPTAVLFFAIVALAVGLDSPPATFRFPWALPLLGLAAIYAVADHRLANTRRALEAGDLNGPPPASALLWYSRALLNDAEKSPDIRSRMQALGNAALAARRATESAEEPFNAWYNLAGILAAQNDAAGAERALRLAIAARPNWFKPHWMLAELLLLEHRTGEAADEAVRAADLDGGKHPEVAATLLRLHK